MKKRLLLDNDGCNFFLGKMTGDIKKSIDDEIRECPDSVTTYLLCPNICDKYIYPAKTGDILESNALMKDLINCGKDPFGMFLDALKKAGKETFITLRMNDVHNADKQDPMITSRFNLEHPDYIVGRDDVGAKKADWMSYCLDYSIKEVRGYKLSIIDELVNMYDVDGLQLDWMRFPRHLPGTGEEVWEKREALTEFTAEVRKILDEKSRKTGKKILLSARIPTNPHGCRNLGTDIKKWTEPGLVDFLVAAPFLTTDFYMPIDEIKKIMGNYPVPVYACIEQGYGESQPHCPESLCAASLSLLDCMADGIYLFNFPCWREYLAEVPYHWLIDFPCEDFTEKRPLLYSVAGKTNRVSGIDLPGQLPLSVNSGEDAGFNLFIPGKALNAWKAVLLIKSSDEVGLYFNGERVVENIFLYGKPSVIFPEYIYRNGTATSDITKSQIFEVSPKLLKKGMNIITIENMTDYTVKINSINLGLWRKE